MLRVRLVIASIFCATAALAQDSYWQQRVEYTMKVSLDVKTHHLSGTQHLVYTNNSSDTLTKVYYYLYFNAFQPGSMMDVRSRTISDPDKRIGERIQKLKDNEIGYQHVSELKQDGQAVEFVMNGTLLEVKLAKPILPHTSSVLDLNFNAQVPLQIRRSGRDNSEGIAYSMTQWYPKLAEYDHQGWHAYPYVFREFHGVWGDFDVTLTLDPTFVVAGTGILQNPIEVGHGYEKPGTSTSKKTKPLSWHFVAKDVIDFAWAADPDYTHTTAQVPGGPLLHFFFQKNDTTAVTWKKMETVAVQVFQYMNEHFGKYPFESYSIIQGGDGGMEYPMCTLILGKEKTDDVLGTMAHEVAHSWFQMALASNESLNAWMDEGYATFASSETMAFIKKTPNPHERTFQAYVAWAKSGGQEPANQHSDHFSTNRNYTLSAYIMGALFLEQLKYLMGDEAFYKGMKRYYDTWSKKHPTPNDFIRVMEKTSGLQLAWFMRYWFNTTKKIDYGFGVILEKDGATLVELKRIGDMPMSVDVLVTLKDGTKSLYVVPVNELLGTKKIPANGHGGLPWPWVNPSYVLKVDAKLADIVSLEIDPDHRMADINRDNNKVTIADIQPYSPVTR